MSLNSSLSRWYPLKDHPVQLRLIRERKRFPVVCAGKRSGKTERFKRFLVKRALEFPGKYFVGGPSRPRVKRIYWDDLCKMSMSTRQPNLSELVIHCGLSTIQLLGLDDPSAIEGAEWAGGGVDEIAACRADTWERYVRSSMDTKSAGWPVGYRPWCWIIGRPIGVNHYYDLCEKAKSGSDPDMGFYHWKSEDILDAEDIKRAKETLDPRYYREQYEASFETTGSKIYSDYGEENLTDETIDPHEKLYWGHDFNYSPLSSAIAVQRDARLVCADEIVLESAIARQSALEFIDRYKGHHNKSVIVYGDPSGRAGEKHGQRSNYIEIEQILRESGWSVERRVKLSAPAIRDRQNAVRAKILTHSGSRSLFVNPARCPTLHRGFSLVELKEGSSFIEQESKWQHITTAIGYLIDYEWPVVDVEYDNVVTLPPTVGDHWRRANRAFG